MAAKKKDKDLNQDDENLNQEDQENTEDSFGLPDPDFEPLEEDEAEVEADQDDGGEEFEESYETGEVPDDEVTYTTDYSDDDDSKAPMVIGIVVIVVIVLGALGYFLGWFDGILGSEPEQQVTEQVQEPEPEPVVEEPEPVVEEEPEPEPAVDETETVAGEIRTITEPTSRYYVIISSSVDEDLAMDRAQELSEEGVSTALITTGSDELFHRLAVGEDFATWQEAQNRANELKGTYGDGLWVMKY